MKTNLLLFAFLFFGVNLLAQQAVVLEDNTLSICDTDLNGGVSADTLYICQPGFEGTTIVNGLCAEYTPDLNYFGYDSVCITTCIAGLCIDTVVNITIQPVGESIYQNTPESAAFFVCESIISGGANVVISGCSPPLYGTDNYNPACVIYTPPTNYIGTDSFCIVSCLDTLCDTSTLVMNMTPVTQSVNVSVPGNGQFTICYSDLQTIVDSITDVNLTCGPTAGTGTVFITDTCVTYTPDVQFDGTGLAGNDQICIAICNSQGVCDVTNVNITITGFQVQNNSNATQLAESLAGAGVTISNAVLNCDQSGTGTFQNAPNQLGVEDGIILSSGTAINAVGPSAGINSGIHGTTGEPDLQALLLSLGETYPVNDACVLEFDIDVLGDSLTFNYVMGSEEYNDYVCGTVNDIFGFFVTGPNPAGPAYASQNVAVLPGATTPVSINTVNNGAIGAFGGGAATCNLTNTAFFNGIVPSISFGGNTVALEAKILTVPCTTYSFKLAIADGGDDVFDSGVFLEAGSFTSLPVTLASSTVLGQGFSNAIEGCVDGVFNFELDEALPIDYGLRFQIGGSAINGVDYNLIQDSLTFFAGDTVVSVNITPIADLIPEGNETVKLYLLNPCTNLPFDSAELNIIDLIPFSMTTDPTLVCPNDTSVISASIAGDDNNLAIYNWTSNNGIILDSDSSYTEVISPITSEYYVEYTLGNCTQFDTTIVEVSQFSVSVDTNLISCPGVNDGGFALIPSNPINAVTYTWQPSGVTDSLLLNLGSDTVSYVVSDNSGLACGTLSDTLYLIQPASLAFNTLIIDVSCFGLNDGSILLSSLSPDSTYQFEITYNGSPLPVQNLTADINGDILLNSLSPGLYDTVIVTSVSNGCVNGFSFSITEPSLLQTNITTPGVVLCAGGTVDSLSHFTSGGTAPYEFLWSTGATTGAITGVTTGAYWLQVIDTNNCVAADSINVGQPNPLALNILADSVPCFDGNDGLAYVDSITGGSPPYSFQWDAATGSQMNDTAVGLTVGTYVLTVLDFNNCPVSDTVEVFQYPAIVLAHTQANVTCFGDSDGSIDLSVSGGVSPYAYSWTGPNTFASINQDVNGLEAGTYVVEVTDANGCLDTLSIDITSPPALALTIDSTNITCKDLSDGTATVTAVGGSGGFIYAWSDALSQNTALATNLDAGTYQVVVTDVNGCVDSSTVNIEEPDSLILTLLGVTDVLCNGASTGAVSVNTAGGTTAYSYQWTNGGGSNEDLSGASAGTYTLTVTDANNCTDQLTATIAEPAALSINLAGTDILCSGGADGEIDATVTGGVIPYTYVWTGPNGYTNNIEDVTGLTGGTYTLSVTDSNNCVLTQTITINEPTDVVITFSDSPVNCFGGNDGSLTASVVSGGTAPFSFQWDAAANNQLTATATGLTAGSYTVTVTDANGCVYTNSASVSEPQAPLSILMDSTNISCAGYNDGTGTASVSGGTPGYSYLWNDPQAQTTATATDLPSGNFQVTVTDANGCVITGSVNIEEPNAINISAVADSTNCFGEATGGISVVASGGTGIGFAYSIDGGETFQSSPDFFNLPAGIYDEIIVQDLGSNIACLSPLTSATVYEQPYFTFEVVPGDTTLQLEESVNLSLNVTSPNYTNNDIAQVSWFPSTGLNCTDCVDPTVLTYDSYTEYTATVYYYGDDNELCNAVASTIIIVENNLALYIPNAFTPSNYDNVNNRFEVYGEGIEYVTMQVYNRIGEKIFESSNQQVGWDGTYKGELQNPGVYTYYVSVEYLDGKVIDRKGSVTLIR